MIENRYVKVEGHPHLVRDIQTNAIINTDSQSSNNYTLIKKRREEEKKKILLQVVYINDTTCNIDICSISLSKMLY